MQFFGFSWRYLYLDFYSIYLTLTCTCFITMKIHVDKFVVLLSILRYSAHRNKFLSLR